jgi:CheY-like chemotaxis protein
MIQQVPSSSGRSVALVVHGMGDVLDFLTRLFEGGGFEVVTAVSTFRAQALLEGGRPIDVVVAPWDAASTVGGELYRWALGHRAELRSRFVFIAEDVPPEFDAVVGGRCLAVPLSASDELVLVSQAAVRRARTPPRGVAILTPGNPALLLVDDDPTLLAAMAEQLTKSGYLVIDVEGGRAAQRALEQRDFDAIITDWQMHDGSGGDLYQWIVKTKPHLAERVIFLSEADSDDSGPVAPGRPMFRKGQDAQALLDVLKRLTG